MYLYTLYIYLIMYICTYLICGILEKEELSLVELFLCRFYNQSQFTFHRHVEGKLERWRINVIYHIFLFRLYFFQVFIRMGCLMKTTLNWTVSRTKTKIQNKMKSLAFIWSVILWNKYHTHLNEMPKIHH